MAKSAHETAGLERSQEELVQLDAESMASVRSKRSGSGGKLNRSETVTVRLDPQLNYLCELAARAHRRTKSSFIEYAVGQALQSVHVLDVDNIERTIDDLSNRLWDVDEPDRLVKLGLEAPNLMTHEEQVIWKVIINCGWFWHGKHNDQGRWVWNVRAPSWDNIRHNWDLILQVANGEKKTTDLPRVADEPPKLKPKPVAFDTDLDDDVPF